MAKRRKRLLTWHNNWNRPGGRWRKYIDGKVRYFGHGRSEDDAKSYREAEQRYLDCLKQRDQTTPAEVAVTKATVAEVCERFLQQEYARHQRGETCATHFDRTRSCIQRFVDFVRPTKRFSAITELDLEAYREQQLSQPVSETTGRPIAMKTVKARLDAVKALFHWGWEMRLCEMPRNLSRYTRVNIPRPEVKTFNVNEVQTLWTVADQRLRCFMALALNCGMGQKDISDLRMAEVDWDNSYIERARSKTGVRGRYKLWPVTLKLMKAARSPQAQADDDRVFLNANGLPLVSRKFVDGKLKVSDAIRNLFWRLQRRTRINDGRGFYCLRKSAATEIERIQATVTEMFLAHAERGMKKHYAKRNWAALDGVLEQLADVYALHV